MMSSPPIARLRPLAIAYCMAHVAQCIHLETSLDHDCHQATVLEFFVVTHCGDQRLIAWHGGQCGTFDSNQDTTRSDRHFQPESPTPV
jgi:hypothetical protein